ncbi:MAG: phosphatidylglycerol lysyltransferase domain-containing protein [Desulfohalobiaceae bacterium]
MQLNFQSLSLTRQAEYRRIFDQTPQKTSDYSFLNIWAWRDIYQLQWAFDGNLVWIRQNDPRPLYWAPVGDWQEVDWPSRLKELQIQELELIRVPEELSRIWEQSLKGRVHLQEDPEQWDYIYSVQELIELKGNRFHRKKNLLRQFQRNYNYRYIVLDADQVDKALTLQTEWCMWKDCEDSTTLEAENQAILNTFQDWNKLDNILGAGIEVDGDMVAYTVAEPLDQETVVVHFEKGCPNHKGVYQAMNQMFLANSAKDFKFVNREQDLGDPGLRKAKESYHPQGYLKKLAGLVSSKEPH